MAITQGVYGLLGRIAYRIWLVSSRLFVGQGELILHQPYITHTCLHSNRHLWKSDTSRRVLWRRSSKGITCVCCSQTHRLQRRTAEVKSGATIRTSNRNTHTTHTRHHRLRTDGHPLVLCRVTAHHNTRRSRIRITDRTLRFGTRSCWHRTTG